MAGTASSNGSIETLVLQALVRKLVQTKVLSRDDVTALLTDAATRLNIDGSPQTPRAAATIVGEDLLPTYLDDAGFSRP